MIRNSTFGIALALCAVAAWAWNFELRYQGAGFWGKLRMLDMVGRAGRAEPFLGDRELKRMLSVSNLTKRH